MAYYDDEIWRASQSDPSTKNPTWSPSRPVLRSYSVPLFLISVAGLAVLQSEYRYPIRYDDDTTTASSLTYYFAEASVSVTALRLNGNELQFRPPVCKMVTVIRSTDNQSQQTPPV
jgi:hypothetical protein